MSYLPLRNEDSLSELISEMSDCKLMCDNMIKCSGDFHSFINWFHKALKVNVRQTFIFAKENKNNFTKKEYDYVCQFFNKEKKDIREFI